MKICTQYSIFILFSLLLCLLQVALAGEEQFQKASQAYSRGDYQTAIAGFEGMAVNGASAELYYNLANSYAQSGQSGKAILNYERTLRLSPGDSDCSGNLELLRKEKGLFQTEQSLQQQVTRFLGMNQWIGLAALSCILFCGVLLLPASSSMKRGSRYLLATVALFLAVVGIFGSYGQYQHWYDGVVVSTDARLRVSPFSSAASIGTIQEGRLVNPGKSHGSFYLVTDETGRTGWLESEAVELIVHSNE